MPSIFSDEAVAQIQQMFREFTARQKNLPGHRGTYFNSPNNRRLGKTTTAHAKAATETVDIYSGATKGSESTTGVTVEAFNRFADVATGKWVFVVFIDGGWELYAGEC